MTGGQHSRLSPRQTDKARLLVKEEAGMMVSCQRVNGWRSGTGTHGEGGTVT